MQRSTQRDALSFFLHKRFLVCCFAHQVSFTHKTLRNISNSALGKAAMFPTSLHQVTSDVGASAASAVGGAWKSFQHKTGVFVDPEDPAQYQEQSISDEFSEMTSLTRMQRIYGFFMALGMGAVFFVIAMSLLPTVALFPKKFAFFFTCGNVFCICSTIFLVGFKRQAETMMESHRLQAATVYVGAMFMTLASALHWQSSVLAMICSAVQLSAVLWYALSFVPFARQTLSFVWTHLLVILKPVVSMLVTLTWKFVQCVCSCKR